MEISWDIMEYNGDSAKNANKPSEMTIYVYIYITSWELNPLSDIHLKVTRMCETGALADECFVSEWTIAENSLSAGTRNIHDDFRGISTGIHHQLDVIYIIYLCVPENRWFQPEFRDWREYHVFSFQTSPSEGYRVKGRCARWFGSTIFSSARCRFLWLPEINIPSRGKWFPCESSTFIQNDY